MWTEEMCLNLIHIYREFPVLWNPRCDEYYKKNKKIDAWSEIGKRLNLSPDQCKNKMIILISSYRREKSRIKGSTGTGQGKLFITYVTYKL